METVEGLTEEQQAVNFETMRHIEMVRNLLNKIIGELIVRGQKHDQSKLRPPEVELFTEYTGKLRHMTYGSEEYTKTLEAMGPALKHHYANNRHHPEHFKDGIEDMSIVDLIEMLCDWKAASTRHNDGNLRKSIEINGNRFRMSPQLIKIFENSVPLVEDTQ
jgi:hypothetical protein